MTINQIELLYNSLEETKPIQLDQCTYIEDPKKTLASLIRYLRGNKGNKRFTPYYDLSVRIVKEILTE